MGRGRDCDSTLARSEERMGMMDTKRTREPKRLTVGDFELVEDTDDHGSFVVYDAKAERRLALGVRRIDELIMVIENARAKK